MRGRSSEITAHPGFSPPVSVLFSTNLQVRQSLFPFSQYPELTSPFSHPPCLQEDRRAFVFVDIPSLMNPRFPLRHIERIRCCRTSPRLKKSCLAMVQFFDEFLLGLWSIGLHRDSPLPSRTIFLHRLTADVCNLTQILLWHFPKTFKISPLNLNPIPPPPRQGPPFSFY